MSAYKPSLPQLDSSFHRDKNLSNSHHDPKPESEPEPQESSAIKKDASHQGTLAAGDGIKNSTGNPNANDNEFTTVIDDDSAVIEDITRKPELDESMKKPPTIDKYHASSKENKINGEETLILGVATDYVVPARTTASRRPEASGTNSHVKVTKSSKSDEKASKTEKTKTIFSTSTLNIETSSSVQVIESTPTRVILRPTSADTNAHTTTITTIKSGVLTLEPSRVPDIDHAEATSTPTDALPAASSTSSITTEKSVARTTSTSMFPKISGT